MRGEMKTTREAAEEAGITPDGVVKAARLLGIRKTGRDYVFSPSDLLRILNRPAMGRPRKNKVGNEK
jgi:hypothetical protein